MSRRRHHRIQAASQTEAPILEVSLAQGRWESEGRVILSASCEHCGQRYEIDAPEAFTCPHCDALHTATDAEPICEVCRAIVRVLP